MLSFSYRFPGMMKGAEGIGGGFGRGVMEILPPPFSRNSYNGLGAAALGDWKARLCPACGAQTRLAVCIIESNINFKQYLI